jgi:hypothetical protein
MNARLFVWSFHFERVAASFVALARNEKNEKNEENENRDEEQEARDFPGLCIFVTVEA